VSGRRKPRSRSAEAFIARLQRSQGVRTLERRHLIVCEDGKSAPAYFKALIRHFGIHASSVQVVGSKTETSPTQIVDRARKLKEEAESPDSGTVPFDEVWCVIDGDYGSKQIGPARTHARRGMIELIVSTPCFEYWILLHFEDSAKPAAECKQVVLALGKHIDRYRKGSFDFGSIMNKALIAGDRAGKRRRSAGESTLPEDQNPCSEIYRLVDELRPPATDVKGKA